MPPKTPRQSGASLPGVATPNLPTFSFGDIVLAKVKGHPAWPARIVDPYVSPLNLRDERKIAQKNSYLVKFFKTADFAWMNAKEMSMLEPTEIQAFINNPNKKGADLKAAYQIALAPEAWEAELEARLVAAQEDYNALEIDELETADAEGTEKASSAQSKQKRKRPSETKSPAMSTKKRKSIDARPTNVPAQASATPEPPVAAPVVKKRGKKKEEPVVPIEGETVVREWRHRLQRLFLGKVPLTEKMMPEIDGVFSEIEEFEMKTEWLTSSKLGKVLKRVGVLEDGSIPLDAKYSIRARARALQEKWRNQLGLGEESTHRSKTADGNDEVKVNGSADDGNGKENTDPTGTKKVEEVVINGKEPTKPSDPEAMKMDEDEPMSVQVTEIDETNNVIEAAPLDEAKPPEPQTEASEVDASADRKSPPETNGDHEAVSGQAETMEAEPEGISDTAEAVEDQTEAVNSVSKAMSPEPKATNAEPEVTNTEPETTKAEPEAANAELEAVSAELGATNSEPEAANAAQAINTETEVVNAAQAINTETEAFNAKADGVNDQPDEAINDKTAETDGKPEAVIDELKKVDGDHASLKEDDESTNGPEKADEDVMMATIDVEEKPDEKATAQEPDDEDQQMDCADTPEPTPVENADADKGNPE